MTRDSKESALSRWSRRKIEAQQALEAERESVTADEVRIDMPPAESAAEEPRPELTDADMPPLDSLTEESDFSPFMSPGVSDELRKLALRKLFGSPVFNIRDGLDEYDDDFTSFEKLGAIVTSDMKHQIEMQRQKLRDKLGAQEEDEDASEDLDEFEDDSDDNGIVEGFDEEAEPDFDGDGDEDSILAEYDPEYGHGSDDD